jgi:hypothetical protein
MQSKLSRVSKEPRNNPRTTEKASNTTKNECVEGEDLETSYHQAAGLQLPEEPPTENAKEAG